MQLCTPRFIKHFAVGFHAAFFLRILQHQIISSLSEFPLSLSEVLDFSMFLDSVLEDHSKLGVLSHRMKAQLRFAFGWGNNTSFFSWKFSKTETLEKIISEFLNSHVSLSIYHSFVQFDKFAVECICLGRLFDTAIYKKWCNILESWVLEISYFDWYMEEKKVV